MAAQWNAIHSNEFHSKNGRRGFIGRLPDRFLHYCGQRVSGKDCTNIFIDCNTYGFGSDIRADVRRLSLPVWRVCHPFRCIGQLSAIRCYSVLSFNAKNNRDFYTEVSQLLALYIRRGTTSGRSGDTNIYQLLRLQLSHSGATLTTIQVNDSSIGL